jgi:hypothetical protein
MKKVIGVAAGLAFALACADSVTEPPGDAPIPAFSAHDNGAVVHRNEGEGIPFGGCAVLDGSGAWYPADLSLACGTEVATFSSGLNATFAYHATGVPNPTGSMVKWNPYNVEGTDWAALYDGSLEPFGFPTLSGPPFPCFVLGTDYDLSDLLFTLNWVAHVTPSGNAMVVCHYSEQWAFDCEDHGNCGVTAGTEN